MSIDQNLFRTFNLIGSCWPEALFVSEFFGVHCYLLLVLSGLGLSIVF